MSTILIINDSYLPPKKAAEIPKNEPIIRATIDSIEMTVPQDPDNRHYQAIQKWVAEGNKIEDAD